MSQRLPYTEGTWFAVPLRDDSRVGIGVIARMDGCGIVLGYFFGPPRTEIPELAEVEHLTAGEALTIRRFGDLSLVDGSWPIIGASATWSQSDWPAPVFGHYDDLLDKGLRVEYDANDIASAAKQLLVSREEAESLPPEGLLGSGAVEIVLTQMLTADRAG